MALWVGFMIVDLDRHGIKRLECIGDASKALSILRLSLLVIAKQRLRQVLLLVFVDCKHHLLDRMQVTFTLRVYQHAL